MSKGRIEIQTNASTTVQDDIHAALIKWIEAVEGQELVSLPEVVAQDSDLVWIGTDATEWIKGYTELEQVLQAQLEALQDIRIKVSEEAIHLYPDTNLAWATNRWVFPPAPEVRMSCFPCAVPGVPVVVLTGNSKVGQQRQIFIGVKLERQALAVDARRTQ